jgi:hypothetical protein
VAEDHNHRAVAKNGHAGEYADLPQLRGHRLDDDLLGMKNVVDNNAEDFAAISASRTRPASSALALIRAAARPRPSSAISITM